MARTSSTLLNKSGLSGNSCLIPDLLNGYFSCFQFLAIDQCCYEHFSICPLVKICVCLLGVSRCGIPGQKLCIFLAFVNSAKESSYVDITRDTIGSSV